MRGYATPAMATHAAPGRLQAVTLAVEKRLRQCCDSSLGSSLSVSRASTCVFSCGDTLMADLRISP